MGKRDPRIDEYIAKAQPFARPILKHLRKAVHAGCPAVEETMKWSSPHFTYKGMLCSMASFKQHCAFGFWKGALLKGAPQSSDAMGHFGRITSLDDLPPGRTLVSLVRQAAALNDAGTKGRPVARRSKASTIEPPADFLAALRKNRKANAAFEAFSPSHRREYVEWIAEAKRDETRQRRIATAVEWLSAGKPRNWKYVGR